MTSKVAYIC